MLCIFPLFSLLQPKQPGKEKRSRKQLNYIDDEQDFYYGKDRRVSMTKKCHNYISIYDTRYHRYTGKLKI